MNTPLFWTGYLYIAYSHAMTVDVIYVPMYHVDTLEVSQSFTDLQTEQGQSHVGKCVLVVRQVISQLMKTRRNGLHNICWTWRRDATRFKQISPLRTYTTPSQSTPDPLLWLLRVSRCADGPVSSWSLCNVMEIFHLEIFREKNNSTVRKHLTGLAHELLFHVACAVLARFYSHVYSLPRLEKKQSQRCPCVPNEFNV